jgi:tRNA modification GTPase
MYTFGTQQNAPCVPAGSHTPRTACAPHAPQGWRPAAPGEFARRAFHAGVLDLTSAEGLADLLNAETAEQRRQALAQASGALRRTYGAWRAELLRCLAHAEAVIDFGEDERIGESVAAAVAPRAAALRAQLAAHLVAADGAHAGELVRAGVRVALGGAPNAGKSSLLNALAGRDVAIVSRHAGTTRDALEVPLDLSGHKVVLTDTAGLRAAAEEVEAEGVARARRALAAAHARVLVLDAADAHAGGAPPEEGEWAHAADADAPLLVVLTKADLLPPAARAHPAALLPPWLARRCASGGAHAGPWLLSCVSGEGVERFCGALRDATAALLRAGGGGASAAPPVVTRLRHAHALRECVSCLDRYAQAPRGADELAAEELRAAAAALGRVTGDVDVEAVLDVIFSEFCIGK